MLSRRGWRVAIFGILGLAILGAVWAGWQAWRVNDDLTAAVADADSLQSAARSGDQEQLDSSLASLRQNSRAAADRTSGLTWSVLSHLPVFGDDARGVRVASDVIADLGDRGLEPLVAAADDFDTMLPRNGGVPVQGLRDLRSPVGEALEALTAAEDRLAEEDSSGYITRLRDKYRELDATVGEVRGFLASADTALEVMPTMLGDGEPRQYLLVLQNNAEIRAAGGLAGSVSVVTAQDGKVGLVRQVPVSSLGEAPAPVLPLTKGERDLYGEVLGTYPLNATMTPDPARASDLLRARWNGEFPDEAVDGVLFVDTVALSYVLEAVGGVTVDGIELTGENLVDELLHNVYLRLTDPAEQDVFFGRVAAAAFQRFTTGLSDGAGVIRALNRAAGERRVLVHSYEETEQRALDGTAVAGGLAQDSDRTPQVMVTLDDTTGAKMSYFLRYDVDVKATWCTDGVQGYTGKASLSSVAPRDAASLPPYVTGGGQFGIDAGEQLVTLRLYAPVGGAIGELRWNGAPMELDKVDLDGREVGMTYVQLAPGEKVDLSWTMRGAKGQTADGVLAVTPTIDKTDNVKALPSACR
ncbi:DUF4012 domain-containing protein [Nocardioides pantholopis]|uniref:DUF4012 domain-containing protein n=1 Tax=Nocardioides pantholopis TaxID=2483798 RepID=UPI000F08EFD5|nr:DUF4012 domain-containing protein [Nocardioides pantholopis]